MARPARHPLAPFFRSETQARVLQQLIRADGAWVSLNALLDDHVSHQTVRDEIARLVDSGFIERDTSTRPHRVRFANEAPLADPLRKLVEGTVGVVPRLREAFADAPGILAAAIYGSWAAGSITPDSDVDVLLLVDEQFDSDRLRTIERAVAAATDRPIDSMVFSPDEARQRYAGGSGFLRAVVDGPLIPLVGDVPELLRDSRA